MLDGQHPIQPCRNQDQEFDTRLKLIQRHLNQAQDKLPPQLLHDVEDAAPPLREGAHRRRAQARRRVRPAQQARALAHAARLGQNPQVRPRSLNVGTQGPEAHVRGARFIEEIAEVWPRRGLRDGPR